MTDSMQFGPEWLRNLSQQANESTMVIPKYQLAEHRYGREEMLALFDKSVSAPEPLRSISSLYVEKIQLPLALIQMSEEETRVWNSSVTIENNPRGVTKSTSNNLTSMNPISMSSGGNTGLSRGRGTSVDRGRGRGARGGTYHYNNRNFSEEGNDPSHPNTAFGRPRIFDRSQSHNSERNWSERNGNADYNDWNGYNTNNAENGLSTSPRKDFGTTIRIASREDTNWRRRPGKDEDDSWRSSRHGRGYTNWREGGERDREKEKDLDNSEPNKDRRWMSRVVSLHSQSNRRNSENKENNLPEWATESPSEVGGSFDSSGAFHGLNSDEEELKEKEYENPRTELSRSNKQAIRTNEISHRVVQNDLKTSTNDQKKNKNKDKSPMTSKTAVKKAKDRDPSELLEYPPTLDNTDDNSSTVTDQLKLQQPTSQHEQQQSSASSQHHKEVFQSTCDEYLNVNSNKEGIDKNRSSSQQIHKLKNHDGISQSESNLEFETPSCSAFDSGFSLNHCDASSMLGLNTSSYPNITSSSSSGSNLDNKLLITPVDIVANSISLINQKDGIDKGFSLSTANVRPKEKEEELDGIVGDVVSKLMEEEEKLEKIKKIENMNKWFYRDPQGILQGPFSSTEMAEWYKLGYFHDKTLMVRRASESNFYPLQKLVSVYGQAPFENVTLQNIDNYAPRLPLHVMGSSGIPSTNMTDDALLLSQPYQTPYDIQSFYARQQALATNKRQLSQAPDELKSLYEQQRLMSSHVNSGADASSAVPPSAIPLVQGYMHPIIPTVPSNNHSLVFLLNQIQQQQQHQQLQQHLMQQQLQQQQQTPPQQSHQHQHSLQSSHQPQPQKSPQDVKSDRMQANLISHLEHPLQQLMHKVNNSSTSNQIPLAQTHGNSYLQSLSSDAIQPNTTPSISTDDNQSSNAIHNLLKQLSMSTEKQSKQVDSVWGPSNSPSVPILNNSTFNAQLWCSQVGKIGPSSSSASSGLWTADGVPTTTAMKTEQQIIESFMKDMERKQDDGRKETETTSAQRRHEEDLIRKLMEESLKKKEAENKLDEEKKAKREEEKRRKRQEDEERLRKIEEEQRKKSVEDAKRREEERRRKEEEKRRKEEEKEHKRKLDEENKKQDVKRKEAEDARKQSNAVRRLKEQQASATANEKFSKASVAVTQEISSDQQLKAAKQNANICGSNKQLLKSQSGIVDDSKKQNFDSNRATANEDRVMSKQLAKSKSSPSVPTQSQKASEADKKEKKKKEKNSVSASAWPDQKKITNVKSLAEIQAEEQKQLAKQIEKERNERLLQQQQAAAAAQAAKEAANVNIWNSQNQPWKTNSTWTSAVSSSSSTFANKNELPATGKTWNEQTRVTLAAAGNSVNKTQPSTANTAAVISTNKSASSNTNAIVKNTSTAKNKQKKEDAAAKKSTSLTLAIPKNDELSKWGVKALSSLKPSVDVPTFIAFLREVESPNDVMEYVTDYLGDGKEIKSFVKQFLEKRSILIPAGSASVALNTTVMSTASGTSVSKKTKKKSEEISLNTTKTPTKQPASKQNSLEFTEVKGKMKKGKKKPMLRLDSAFLGFNVTAAPDRINVGDRDYGEDLY